MLALECCLTEITWEYGGRRALKHWKYGGGGWVRRNCVCGQGGGEVQLGRNGGGGEDSIQNWGGGEGGHYAEEGMIKLKLRGGWVDYTKKSGVGGWGMITLQFCCWGYDLIEI